MHDGTSPDPPQPPGLNGGKALNIPASRELFNGDLPPLSETGRRPCSGDFAWNHGEEPFAPAKHRLRRRRPTAEYPTGSAQFSCGLEQQVQAALKDPGLALALKQGLTRLFLKQRG